MKKRVLIIILFMSFFVSCKNNVSEYSGLNEFEVVDIDLDNLLGDDAMKAGQTMVHEKYPKAEINFKIEDRIRDEIDLNIANVKAVAEFRATDENIIILDQEDHNIKIIDWEGNLIKTIGKLGSGDMEFKTPTAFYYDEENELYYILDDGNSRIVVTDENFKLIKNISSKILKDKSSLFVFNSIVVFRNKIYISQSYGREKTMAIICIDNEGEEKLFDQKFGGFLKVIDDKLYAIESVRGFKFGKKVNTSIGTHEFEIWSQCGDTIYEVDDYKMKKIYSLPNGSWFTDILKIENMYFLSSSCYGFISEFSDVNSIMNYIRTLNKQIRTERDDNWKRFRMQEYKGDIIISDYGTNNIYIVDIGR